MKMNRILIISVLLFVFIVRANAQKLDSIVDSRDAKVYKTIKIGEQVWMAQNLDFQSEGSWCYHNIAENCDLYGKLYDWEAAKNACPPGWHLPSDLEWQTLEKFLGMSNTDLEKNNAWRGTDQGKRLVSDSNLGFNLLYGGYRNPPSNYNLLKMQAFLWTSTEQQGSAWIRQLYEGSTQIFRQTRPVSWAFSVRCVKN
jgi:uncharacterized protein (TIGR02145 family)